MLKPHERSHEPRKIRDPMKDRMGNPWTEEELPDMHYQDAHKIVTESDEALANGATPTEHPKVVQYARDLVTNAHNLYVKNQ